MGKVFGLEFRKIGVQDLDLLEGWYGLTNYFGYATGFKRFSEINQIFLEPHKQNNLVLMIETSEDKKPIGFIYGELKNFGSQTVLWIYILMIETSFQRKGYGTFAVQKLLQSVKVQIGPLTCFVAVSNKNEQGLSFWQKAGFYHSSDLEGFLSQKGPSHVAILKKKIY